MNRYPWLDGYLMDRPGAEQDYKLEWQWQRYLVRGRMFAAVCTPGAEHKLHAGRTRRKFSKRLPRTRAIRTPSFSWMTESPALP